MNQHILYNFASRSRPQRFLKVYDTIKNLSANQNDYTILAKLDIDDTADYSIVETLDKVTIVYGRSENKVHAINRNIPESGWDILVNVSDDTPFIIQGFDDIIRKHCGPDDFVMFPEPFVESQFVKGKNERISVLSVMGIDYYRMFNYIYHPSYVSLFCDNEATHQAKALGRLVEVEDKIFFHEHRAAGYPVNDAQYRRTESFWDIDKATFYKRQAEGFPA